MGFCRPDSAHCHLETPHLQCPRTWPVGRPPHRPSQLGRLTPPQPTPPPPPCSAVLRGVWRFSGVFASAGIWRPRENGRQDAFCPARTVEKMGDRGRDALSARYQRRARAHHKCHPIAEAAQRRATHARYSATFTPTATSRQGVPLSPGRLPLLSLLSWLLICCLFKLV